MTRTGLFRYVRHSDMHAHLVAGWMPVADLGDHHGQWSVLCWHCDCGEVTP